MGNSISIEHMKSQELIERTTEGWPLSSKAKDVISKSLALPEEYLTALARCKNCGLIANQKFFSAGCPNCNAKDIVVSDPN